MIRLGALAEAPSMKLSAVSIRASITDSSAARVPWPATSSA
jgi:hypothetical protein